MKWEVPLLLGFLLFFSTWNSLPVTNGYYFDSNNIKHYILTQTVSSYHNDIDNLTNILFIKYENPWNAHNQIVIILVTDIFILQTINESVQIYIQDKILILSKSKFRKHFYFILLIKSHNLREPFKKDCRKHDSLIPTPLKY